MAYITQYQADMNQDAKDKAFWGDVGDIGANYFQNQRENRLRALANARADQELLLKSQQLEMEREQRGIQRLRDESQTRANDAKAKFYESGGGRGGAYKETPEQKSQRKLDDQKKLMAQKSEFEKQNSLNDPAFEVPGMGYVRTADEAKAIRTAKADAETAKQYIEEIKKLGTNVSVFDRDRIGKINQLKQALVGKLRLPLMGPGTMTEDEFQRTVGNLGDPSAVFGTESNEIGKLNQMSGILDNNISAMYQAAAREPAQKTGPQAPAKIAPPPGVRPETMRAVEGMTPEQRRALRQQITGGAR